MQMVGRSLHARQLSIRSDVSMCMWWCDLTNCLTLLVHSVPVTLHLSDSLSVLYNFPVFRRCVTTDDARLRKCYTGWHPGVPAYRPFSRQSWMHSIWPLTRSHCCFVFTLTSCAKANNVQAHRPIVHPRTGVSLPGCCLNARSTMTAFVFDLSTGCTTNTALYDWRPSFPACRSKTCNRLPLEVMSSSL